LAGSLAGRTPQERTSPAPSRKEPGSDQGLYGWA
jgi:hypothetical protein